MQFFSAPRFKHRPRSSAAIVLACALSCAPLSSIAQTGGPVAVPIDLPAQSLDKALIALGRQTSMQISFAPETVAGKIAPELKGTMTPQDAVHALLAGSGLTVRKTGENAVTVEGGSAIVTSAAPAGGTLNTVVVQGIRPSLYSVPDVNVGALGSKDPMDLPMSISSYTSELITAQASRTLMDVLKNDPSVQNTAVGGAMDNISIRGFPIDWTNTMRRDGMPVAPYYDIPLENTERIDVLKGPSGFLYGVNSPGGTVNYVMKRPTQDRFTSATAELRSYDGYYGAIDTGGPIADGRLGYRFNVAGERVGNFNHAGDRTRTFVSGALDWEITPRALLRFDFDYQDKKLAAQPVIGLQPDGSLPPQFDPRTLLGQPWLQYRTSTFNVGGRFDFKLTDNWNFTTQIAQSYNNRDAAFPDIYSVAANGDILSGDIYLSPDQSFRVLSTNTFVSGRFNTGPLAHQLVTGISTRNYDSHEGGFAAIPLTVGNIFNPVYSPEPATVFPQKNATKNFQPSVFISDLIDIGSQWSVMLGVRHVKYRNDSYPASGTESHYETSVNVPSAGLIFKPRPDISTYVSYSEGFEQGGVAPYNTLNAGQYLSPVKSKQYEVGAKSDIGGRLTINAAVFRIEKTLQYVNSANYYVQGGTQRHTGVELTANGRITRDLSVVAGAAYLDTVQNDTGDPQTNGKRAANVPRFQANAFLDYRIPAVAGLSVDTGVYYVGSRPLDAQNTVSLPGYVRFDAGARYLTKIGGLATVLRAGVQNLTDKRYWAAANYSSVWPGIPRTFFVSAQIDM
ncbi:ligand-gated channel [Burkholderia sp. SFA1]|uniref:TonB-dependent siderophore receptor n=1 Tax=unclassified Caballeronia TaxID=2646786 RepID=UPI001F240D2F|nr:MULTISPECIES: TonB-dependent receptor [unclassified Caballeronia]MCE4544878.1 TonB-dependent receptor [Caballeronia sp. PC1]MCE4570302.1 TonB-dependent receptor [Caballeronia sp. CLC5]BBP98140.1 ligand-gated channel [Burkholderia sp. SFA1]